MRAVLIATALLQNEIQSKEFNAVSLNKGGDEAYKEADTFDIADGDDEYNICSEQI